MRRDIAERRGRAAQRIKDRIGAYPAAKRQGRGGARHQTLRRGGDATARRIAQQRREFGRPCDADPDRHGHAGVTQVAHKGQDRRGGKHELRDDVRTQSRIAGRRKFVGQSPRHRIGGDDRMALRMTSDADLLDSEDAPIHRPDQRERIGIRPERLGNVAADHQHAAHPALAASVLEAFRQIVRRRDPPRREMQHRIEPGAMHGDGEIRHLAQTLRRDVAQIERLPRRHQRGQPRQLVRRGPRRLESERGHAHSRRREMTNDSS